MRCLIRWFENALILCMLCGCTPRDAEPAGNKTGSLEEQEFVAAWIDDEPISDLQLLNRYRVFFVESGGMLPDNPAQRQALLYRCVRDMAEVKILLQEAKDRGITVDLPESEVTEFLNEPDEYPRGFEALEDEFQGWHDRLRIRLLTMKTTAAVTDSLAKDLTITEEAVHAEYDANQDRFIVPMALDLRAIRVFKLELAEDIHKKLLGGWDFVKLAERYSTLRNEESKGQVYHISILDLPADSAEILVKLSLRRPSPVITADNGYFIFRVEKRYPERLKSFDEVRDQLADELLARDRSALFRKWLDQRVEALNIRMGTPIPHDRLDPTGGLL